MYDIQASKYTCDSSVFIGRESEGGMNGNDSWRYVAHRPISLMGPKCKVMAVVSAKRLLGAYMLNAYIQVNPN